MNSLSHATTSRYTLHHTLADMGFEPLRIATAVEVLMGPETEEELYEPTEDDLADYREWCMDVDRRWEDDRFEADGYVTDADVALVTGSCG